MQKYKKNVIYANIPHYFLVKNTKSNNLSIRILRVVINAT